MADRFPSLEDIDAGQVETKGDASFNGVDTEEPSDFLARERAILGDDASQFTTPGDKAATIEDDDDLLAGGESSQSFPPAGDDDMGEFESSFPAVDTQNDNVAPGGTITGSGLPYRPTEPAASEPEPEVVREWRERRDMAIQHRDEVSAEKKAATTKAAHTAIDEFYESYNNKKDKTIAQTRRDAEEFLKNREDTTSGGTSWDRIAKLVDLTGKGASGGAAGTGKAKFRDMLVNLRKDEKAPGATGV